MTADRRWAIDQIWNEAVAHHSTNANRALADEAITLFEQVQYWYEKYEREKWARIQAERNQSAGYMRRVGHPSPASVPAVEAITDDWIDTGREA